MKKKGFTLIELLVVIAVIGILASVVLASLNSARTKARNTRRKADIRELSTAIQLYYSDYGTFPASVGSVADTTTSISNSGDWPGPFKAEMAPYISKLPVETYANFYGVERMNRAPDAACNGQFVVWMYLEGTTDPDYGKSTCGWQPLHYFRLLGPY